MPTPCLVTRSTWLRGVGDPIVDLRLAAAIDHVDESTLDTLRRAVHDTEIVRAAFSAQRSDGSWGEDEQPERRILPTLAMVQTLAELGAGFHERWSDAADFLAARAHTESRVFSLNRRADGVLSCYVGIAAAAYLSSGRAELAEPQLDWIRRHQDVRTADRRLRPDIPAHYADHLATRYGGCMARTTCLVGLAKTGRALSLAGADRSDPVLGAIRDAFLERELLFRSNGSVVPLGVAPDRADEWLVPTFPLGWRTDIVEVLDVVTRSGPPDERMQPALDHLAVIRLEDGTWPLCRTYWPGDLRVRERRSLRRGSAMATLRVVVALDAIGAAVSAR